jgi:hypothetical protein
MGVKPGLSSYRRINSEVGRDRVLRRIFNLRSIKRGEGGERVA